MTSVFSRYIHSPLVYLLGLALGLMQAMVFDYPFDSPVVFLSPIFSGLSILGFLWFLQYLSPSRAIRFGYFFGLGVFSWGLNWIYISMDRFGGASTFFSVLANIAVIAYLALYWLLIAYLITKLGKTANQRLLLAAPIIALCEWLRSVFLLGFPWLSIGYGWIDTPITLLASLGGVWLVSFVVVFSCVLLLLHIQWWQKVLCLLSVILLCVALWSVISTQLDKHKNSPSATVALIQGNMPVITEYNDRRMQANLDAYSFLTDVVLDAEQSPDMVIWPESAIPYFHNEISRLRNDFLHKQREKHFDFISGLPYVDIQQRQFYNAIMLQKAQSDASGATYYLKQHLLPFGEYLPFRGILDFFEDYVSIPMSEFSRGELIQPNFLAAGLKIAPSICFEAAFGDEIRQSATTADVLLNISNDAWFGKSKAQTQHLNIARMRAVENQKYLIRATNNGRTAIVSPQGKVVESLPPFRSDFLLGRVSARTQQTLYNRWGDNPWLLFFFLFTLLIIASGYCQKNRDNDIKV